MAGGGEGHDGLPKMFMAIVLKRFEVGRKLKLCDFKY